MLGLASQGQTQVVVRPAPEHNARCHAAIAVLHGLQAKRPSLHPDNGEQRSTAPGFQVSTPLHFTPDLFARAPTVSGNFFSVMEKGSNFPDLIF